MAGVLSPQSGQDMVFVGTTNGGPPASGSFVAGNWCHDNQAIFLCVRGGTPGVWANFGLVAGFAVQSITGATTAAALDSVILALVGLGLATDNR